MTSYDKDFVRARNRGQAQRAWAAFCAVLMVVLFPWDDTTAAGQPRGQVFSVPEGVVQNGRFVETETGVIEVTYDLVSSASDALFAVELYVSEDGQNFVQATSVTGDIGSGIAPGTGKRITWRWTNDLESLAPVIDQFQFQVRTESASLASQAQIAPPPDEGGINPLVWVGITGGGGAGAFAALGGGGDKTPPITACTFSVSPTQIQTSGSGGTESVQITVSPAGCTPTSWNASASANWISVDPSSGNGNGSVTLTILTNTTANSRTGSATVAGRTLNVQQDAGVQCTFAVTPMMPTIGPAGGTRTFTITQTQRSCVDNSWTTSSSQPWVGGFTPSSGNGSGATTAKVLANSEPDQSSPARTAFLTIAGQDITLNQTANTCNFTFNSNATDASASGVGRGESFRTLGVSVASSCDWTGTSGVPWITFSSHGDGNSVALTGNQTLTLRFSMNGGGYRQGEVKVAGTVFEFCQEDVGGSGKDDVRISGTCQAP